jgi:hypothetical protein
MEKKKDKKETKTIKYKPFPIRMHDETMQRLKEERIKSGLSWNLYLIYLLDNQRRLKQ